MTRCARVDLARSAEHNTVIMVINRSEMLVFYAKLAATFGRGSGLRGALEFYGRIIVDYSCGNRPQKQDKICPLAQKYLTSICVSGRR